PSSPHCTVTPPPLHSLPTRRSSDLPGPFPVEHRQALGGRVYGCDECQVVCPPNRLEDRRHPPPPATMADEAWVDLVAMLDMDDRSEEHTSELQSLRHLVCRLLLEKK